MMDAMTPGRPPTPFEVHESGKLLHGTKADLDVGEVLTPGHASNFEDGRHSNYVYVSGTLDAAAWGAELARGDAPGRIYIVEVDGELEDDPNLTDKKFPGNPTRSFRTRAPVRIVGELTGWIGHTPEQQRAMRDSLATLISDGRNEILD
jgi:rifampin ADP-ribosylating transferase